jgi:hypothetical protein
MKKTFVLLSIILASTLTIENASAQILPPPAPGPSSGPGPASVPLDPVSWVMLASGGGLAAKKYYNRKKENEKLKD